MNLIFFLVLDTNRQLCHVKDYFLKVSIASVTFKMFLKSHQIITSYDQIIDLLIHGWDKIINFLEEVVGFYIGYMLFLA